jgi:hypothetical protein
MLQQLPECRRSRLAWMVVEAPADGEKVEAVLTDRALDDVLERPPPPRTPAPPRAIVPRG